MASTAEDLRNREIKLLKADGPQFVQRNDKLQGTKAVEPNNATSPHEVEVPSLDRLDLNENSNGVIEDLSDDAWLRKLLYGEGNRRDFYGPRSTCTKPLGGA